MLNVRRAHLSDPSHPPHINPTSSPAAQHVTAQELTRLLEMSPDALLVIDRAGTIALANEETEAMFGYGSGELHGQPLEVLLPERFRDVHLAHRAGYAAAPRRRPMGVGLQLFGQRKDDFEFPVDISLRPVLLDGAPYVIGAIRDMTEQRTAERERALQLQRIRVQNELINRSHDAILVRDPLSRVLSWNRGAEELYGWSERQALGRISHTLLKTRFPTSRAAVDEALEREGQWEGELTHTRRDGSTILVESRQVHLGDEHDQPNAILEINRDVTGRRRLEQAGRAAHVETAARLSFLQHALDALPSGVYLVYGSEARLLLANRTASVVWGAEWQLHQPMQEFLASHRIGLFDAQGRPLPPEAYATLRAVRKGEMTLQQQETIRRPNGSNLPIIVSTVVLPSHLLPQDIEARAEGAEPGTEDEPLALVVLQDVTALKEAEYLKDEFLGIAAHELRAPLAVLKGYADMLIVQTARHGGAALAEWQQEALEEIKLATARLVDLTEELLEVTRLQAGRLHLHCAPTNLVPLTRRVAEHLQKTTTRNQLEVILSQPLLVADVDPGRVEQVLFNLIGNAIKYSPRGGPITIRLWEEATGQVMHLSVQDPGIGIPAHEQAQIFGRFMRADNAKAWGISGTGLGLYLSRELVEQHGGHLWFESEEGTGSTFFLTLPIPCICGGKSEPVTAGGDL